MAITKKRAEKAVRVLLEYIGEDPDRDGLAGTPDRVVRYLREATEGMSIDPAVFLEKDFANGDDDSEASPYEGMVVEKNIDFFSLCEHHMIVIEGTAHIAYIPGDKVVGLSKLARVVDAFARRLTIQEKMTSQIADTLEKGLNTSDVAVVIDAKHYCMISRGVRKKDSSTRTAVLRGMFMDSDEVRNELMFHLQ